MVHFIDAETDKTIAQLRKVAEQMATVSYDQIINADTSKVRAKVQDLYLMEEQKRQVEISRLVSKARLSVQEAQHKKVKELKNACIQSLAEFTSDRANYEHFMRKILVEAIDSCALTQASIQLRSRDAEMLPAIATTSCKITLSKQQLPDSAIGGFILQSEDGSVCVDCTLAERLEQGLKCMEPTILNVMFPASMGLWES